jgi:hypothetical protein
MLLRDLHRIDLMMYANAPRSRGLERIDVAEQWQRPRRFVASPELEFLRDMRWPSLVFGLLTVVFTYRASLRAWGDPQLAVLSAGVLASTPQFLFTSAYVSNDTAATAIAAAAFWLVEPRRSARTRRECDRERRHLSPATPLLTALRAIHPRSRSLPGLAVLVAALRTSAL